MNDVMLEKLKQVLQQQIEDVLDRIDEDDFSDQEELKMDALQV